MSELRVNNIADAAGTSHPTIEKADLAKAWINITHGTPVNNQSFNVSSVADVAVGRSDVNFTNAFSAATYCVTGTGSSGQGVSTSETVNDFEARGYTISGASLSDITTSFLIAGDLA